jgi:transcriptional regulator with XRE-family HTH domain
MSQKPAKRHVLAEVRIKADLSQAELAKILGVATISVQKIEQGHLSLSEELAVKAQKELGVSAAWLLANDPAKPAVTPRGGLWTMEFYQFAQGSLDAVGEEVGDKMLGQVRLYTLPPSDNDRAQDAFIALTRIETDSVIHALLEATKGRPVQGILIHRIRTMLNALREQFTPDKATLKKHRSRTQKARKTYEDIYKKIGAKELSILWTTTEIEKQ